MRRLLVPTVLLLYLLVPAVVAHADYRDLWLDCRDEKIDGTYNQSDYRKALANLPADNRQYTDCGDVIRAAQLASARAEGTNKRKGGTSSSQPGGGGGGGGGSSSGGSAPVQGGGQPLSAATPQELSGVTKASAGGGAPVTIGGEIVQPSSLGSGRKVAASVSDIPGPLLAVLVLLIIAGVSGLVLILVPRVRNRRNA